MKFTAAQVEQLAKEFETKSAQEILGWALELFGPNIGLASSFGAEDVVLVDMMVKINKEKTHVFTLETGRLNQETYDVMDDIRAKYGINIMAYFPNQKEVEEMIRKKGMNLMYASVQDRKLCCEIRKVHPLNRALAGLDGWITGLRRDQLATRADTKKIELDFAHNGIVKLNPISDWSSNMVWEYIKKNEIPYNKLHEKGYPSIGCEPCTRAVQPGEDPRAGRWWWENAAHKECGLHFDPVIMRKKEKE
jgi:phosphoadenosine phosphosulfate reductase